MSSRAAALISPAYSSARRARWASSPRPHFARSRLPGGTCLSLLGFPKLEGAIRAAQDLRGFAPVSCDLLDSRLLSLSRHGGPAQAVGLVPPSVGAALVLTFEGDTEREASRRTWEAIEHLRGMYRLGVLAEPACDPEGMARIRGIREASVAGLYALGTGPRPVACIEDVGVPVESLTEFIIRTQDLLQRFERALRSWSMLSPARFTRGRWPTSTIHRTARSSGRWPRRCMHWPSHWEVR